MTFPKIKRAIFPVAGFGTRFLPVTKSQPKEMLPIVDKPVLHYLVEEAVSAGIEEIILVTGRGKQSIEDYFDASFELEYNLVEKKKHGLLKAVKDIPNMARFVYVRQPIPLGDGHAILCAKELIGNEPCAVIYGDDIVKGEQSALQQMLETYQHTGSSVIGLTEVPHKDVNNYGIVDGDRINDTEISITNIIEKPNPTQTKSNKAIIGKYILTPEVLGVLETVQEGTVGDGEIRLADGLIKAISNGINLHGKMISGQRYDAGSKVGFIKATIDYALDRPELAVEIKAHLRQLDLS